MKEFPHLSFYLSIYLLFYPYLYLSIDLYLSAFIIAAWLALSLYLSISLSLYLLKLQHLFVFESKRKTTLSLGLSFYDNASFMHKTKTLTNRLRVYNFFQMRTHIFNKSRIRHDILMLDQLWRDGIWGKEDKCCREMIPKAKKMRRVHETKTL